MAYVRKTVDRWDIEMDFGCGWEVVCSEYTLREAKEQYRFYLANVREPARLVKRREKK